MGSSVWVLWWTPDCYAVRAPGVVSRSVREQECHRENEWSLGTVILVTAFHARVPVRMSAGPVRKGGWGHGFSSQDVTFLAGWVLC